MLFYFWKADSESGSRCSLYTQRVSELITLMLCFAGDTLSDFFQVESYCLPRSNEHPALHPRNRARSTSSIGWGGHVRLPSHLLWHVHLPGHLLCFVTSSAYLLFSACKFVDRPIVRRPLAAVTFTIGKSTFSFDFRMNYLWR